MENHIDNAKEDVTALSFEETYSQLTESVNRLEKGGLTLNEATQLYMSGIRLANHASELLNKAELQISTISDPDRDVAD